ncbi:hypothetical protein Zmor_005573 [Zophobas morio]|uniref:RNA-directed DNA polymerase n=2 Tax=Zophobas morio TaxID=2755281 RepID=A0AA38MMC4_9CUCU|nr:hypothetical protein Zmor_005573 [Zophobas morio]
MTIQMSAEQFNELINGIRDVARPREADLHPSSGTRHFSHCPARFNGSRNASSVEEFITTASLYKRLEKISDEDALETLPILLREEALTWWNGVRNSVNTWPAAVQLIRDAFAPRAPNHRLFKEIFDEPQGDEVSTDAYITRQRERLSRMSRQLDEQWQMDILYGLLRRRLRDRIARTEVDTFADLLHKARAVEESEREGKNSHAKPNGKGPKADENRSRGPRLRCDVCRAFGHDTTACRRRPRGPAPAPGPATRTPAEPVRCYGCNAPGVFRRNCPTCNTTDASQPARNMAFCALRSGTIQPRSRPAIHIKIAGEEGTGYLDTAACNSVASATLYRHLIKTGHKARTENVIATLADGTSKHLQVPAVTTKVGVQGRHVETTFIVLSDSCNTRTLLGADFIEDARIIPDLARRRFYFGGDITRTYPFVDVDGAEAPARKGVPTTIKEVRITQSEPMEAGDIEEGYGPPPPAPPKRDTSKGLVTPHGIWTTYQAPYATEHMWEDAETAMTTGEMDEYEMGLFPDGPRRLFITSLHLQANEGTGFTEPTRAKFDDLVDDFADAFEAHGPPTPYAEHRIDTGDHAPIAVPPYQLNATKKQLLKEEVEKMIQAQVIEECDSPWAAPIVLIPKKDGSVRPCVDYRKLNAVTRPDAYPLPRLDDLLHSVGPIGCMSTLDLQAGYWQIQMRPEDRDKTAFICPFGLFRFRRLPFGLRNAPASFQRLMDRFKSGLPNLTLLAYLDDLIVISADEESHLEHLREVFERLRTFKLRVNREKCQFGCHEVRYLGHVLSPAGIAADPNKVHAVTQMSAPRNVKQLQSFIQTCSWFRRFITAFATVAKPLCSLLKKDAAWQWDSTHQEAFEELKQRLADAPILRQANPEEPFVLRTDASAYALGAALLQGEGPEERPIEYASRLLTNHEQNYTTTEREALAIVWAVRRFRGYLEESSTVVITDHQPLRWLMTLKTPTGRLARWALQLQPYHLTIEYTPGKANVVADMLSRPHLPEVAIDSVEVDLPTRKANELRSEQRKDEEIRKIMDDLVHAQAEISQQWTSRGYLLNQGVLYRYSQDGESEEAQLVVPKHERPRVLAEYHDSPTAGHYGVERTYYRIKRRYYWTGMRRYITDYLKGCIDCQRYKAPNLKPAGLLQTPAMGHRMEVLAVDLFGPLPPTKEHHRWVLIVEDYATRWVELFTLAEASAEACATTLVTEVFLRYGIPRRIVSDNGTQFISAVMQKITFCLGITQSFTPVYHPEANPVERKNRDLKTQLAIQIGNQPHENWDEKIPSIRFAMNSAWCSGTGYSPAYLMFGRDLRTVDDVTHDLRAITLRENFVPEATPLLLTLDETLKRAREIHESEQDRRKRDQDRHRKTSTAYAPGDLVLVKTHRLSKASQGFTSKFAPKQDGPYVVLRRHGPTSYEIAAHQQPDVVLGLYHASDLVPYQPPTQEATQPVPPVQPLRRRGRPRKIQQDQ